MRMKVEGQTNTFCIYVTLETYADSKRTKKVPLKSSYVALLQVLQSDALLTYIDEKSKSNAKQS